MKKQITNKALQDVLKEYDDNYIIQLGINEETDLLTHAFIDSDNGVIDLTNFVEEDETQPHIVDTLGNNVYKDDTILFYYNGIKKGTITDIKNITVTDTYYTQFLIKYDEKYITLVTENNNKAVDIVKFNY